MTIKVIYLCGIIFLIAFLITLAFVPGSISLAHKIGAIDIPKDNRRVHTKPIPRIGGVAIFLAITVSAIIASAMGIFEPGAIDRVNGLADLQWDLDFLKEGKLNPMLGVVLGGAIIFIVGFIDDLKGMKPIVKLLGQIAAASFVFAIGMNCS